MEDSSNEFVDFAIFPIETVMACNYILDRVHSVLKRNVLAGKELCHLQEMVSNGEQTLHMYDTWPVILRIDSSAYKSIADLYNLANFWIRHISFPEESQERMESCLRLDPGFSASGLVLNENGSLLNRDMVALSQSSLAFYRKAGFYFDDDFLEHARTSHQEFLLTMIWVRQDSIRRMFKPGFEGSYRERTTEVEDADTVPGVVFEDPGMSDDTSTAAVLTPSITRSTSPAITERSLEPGQDETRRDCSTMSTELPTLEFMAIIETSTDKAIFRMGGSDIHDTARAKAYTGLNMCEHMIRKGYGGKVKLQDILDMALRTA